MQKGNTLLGKTVGLLLLIMIATGMWIREVKVSLVDPEARFNLLLVDQEGKRVSVVSYDPVEQKELVITYPPNLAIASRSVGEYEMNQLYALGSYKNSGGEFARRKVQGFMRLPIVGYIVKTGSSDSIEKSLRQVLVKRVWSSKIESNLSRFDAVRLWWSSVHFSAKVVGEDELIRSGIIKAKTDHPDEYTYEPERLATYVGNSFFDWGVGVEGATVAIVNDSGVDGLGSDLASFVESMGLDVINVKSGSQTEEHTHYQVQSPKAYPKTIKLIENVFDFPKYLVGDNSEYRADIVFWAGSDSLELF